MSENHTHARARTPATGPWVVDTKDLARSPGASKRYRRTVTVAEGLGFGEVIGVRKGTSVDFEMLAESVLEGVLVSGTAQAGLTGECARCLEELTDELEVEFRELFAYPNSTTEETTSEDEVYRLADDMVDMEPVIRDAIVLALPQAPLCSPDCQGLCAGCGAKWAELPADHTHETMDPRWAALREWFGESSGG
jgi:uncharacterized protein